MTSRRRGFSLVELLIVIAIILVLITIALPNMRVAQMHAKEVAAQAAIRAVQSAQVQYQSQFGSYAHSLAELGPPATGASGPAATGLLGPDMAQGEKNGYRFAVAATPDGYSVTAIPAVFNSSGRTIMVWSE